MTTSLIKTDQLEFGKAGIRMAKQNLRKFGLRINEDNLNIIIGIMIQHTEMISLMGGTVVWPEDTFKIERTVGRPRNIFSWLMKYRATLRFHSCDERGEQRTVLLKVGDKVSIKNTVDSKDVEQILGEMREEIEKEQGEEENK